MVINMDEKRTIAAGEFKAKCLKLMDEVQSSGEEIVITKHGTPVAKLAPVEQKLPSLFGCMKGSIEILGNIMEPVDAGWEDVVKHWDELHGNPPEKNKP